MVIGIKYIVASNMAINQPLGKDKEMEIERKSPIELDQTMKIVDQNGHKITTLKWSPSELVFESDPLLELQQKLYIVFSLDDSINRKVEIQIESKVTGRNKVCSYNFAPTKSNDWLGQIYTFFSSGKHEKESIIDFTQSMNRGVELSISSPNEKMQSAIAQQGYKLRYRSLAFLGFFVTILIVVLILYGMTHMKSSGKVYKKQVFNIIEYSCDFTDGKKCSEINTPNNITYFFKNEAKSGDNNQANSCLARVQKDLNQYVLINKSTHRSITLLKSRLIVLQAKQKLYEGNPVANVEAAANQQAIEFLDYEIRILLSDKIDLSDLQPQLDYCNKQLSVFQESYYVGSNIRQECLVVMEAPRLIGNTTVEYPESVTSDFGVLSGVGITPLLQEIIVRRGTNVPYVYGIPELECSSLENYELINLHWSNILD